MNWAKYFEGVHQKYTFYYTNIYFLKYTNIFFSLFG